MSSNPETYSSRSPIGAPVAAMLVENRNAFLRFLTRRVGNRDLAEDLLQQFYLRAISKGSDLKKRESVQQWLYRVLRSTLVDHYRALATSQKRGAEYASLQPTYMENFTEETEALCVCFYRLLPALKADYAELLQRIDLSGESRGKVARDLGITLNLVRVRLHRARQALKDALLASCKGCGHGFLNCDCSQNK